MYLLKRIPVVFILFFFYSYSANSQSIEKLKEEAESALNQGDAAKALSLSVKIVAQSEKKFSAKSPEYALALKDHAVFLFYNNEVEKAISTIQKSLEIYESVSGKTSKAYAEALSDYAGIVHALNELTAAEEAYATCKKIYSELSLSQTKEYGILANNLAEVKRASGKMEEAEVLYREALLTFDKLNLQKTEEYASLLNNIANLYHDLADYSQAKSYYEKALDKYEEVLGKESAEYSNVYKNYGVLLIDMGKYDDALVVINKVSKAYLQEFGESSMEYASCLNDQANIYDKSGNYKKAEALYLKAEVIKEKQKSTSYASYWNTQNNLAMLYGKLGSYSKGISKLEMALKEMKEAGSEKTPQYADFLNNLASLQEGNNDFVKAEQNYKTSLGLFKEIYGTDHPDYSRVLNNLALANAKNKNYNKAETLYLESAAILEKRPDVDIRELAITYNNLGELYSVQKNFEKAEPLFNKSMEISREQLGEKHPVYNQYLSNLGLLYYRWNKWDKALEIQRRVLDQNIKLLYENFSFLSEEEKFSYWKLAGDNFRFFNAFCLNAYTKYPNLAGEMFDYSLETKSLILNHTSILKKRIEESKNEELKSKFKNWQEKRELLSSYYNLRKTELKRRGVNIEQLENEIIRMEKELVTTSSEFGELRNAKRKSWKDVRDKLKDNEAAVEIIRVEQFRQEWEDSVVYVALIVTKQCIDKPFLVVLPEGKKMEKKYFRSYVNGIKFDKANTESYTIYWKDIDKYLAGKNVIYVSPSGVYNKISLPSLKMPDGKYLLEQKQIQLIPGLKNFIGYKPVQNSSNMAVLFGYPNYNLDLNAVYGKDSSQQASMTFNSSEEVVRDLGLAELPGTKIEVENVFNILTPSGFKVTKYMGNEALESKLKNISNPRILHIATHGFFLRDEDLTGTTAGLSYNAEKALTNPLLRSGILLAGANNYLQNSASFSAPEDGILTAYEAMHFNLSQTELVILSACETGLGEELNGEGILGLQRSLQVAGAKNVLMSLWKVSDNGTQDLMNLFYKYWMTDKNVSSAFRKAQMELMKKYPSPYYWAAFVLVGVN